MKKDPDGELWLRLGPDYDQALFNLTLDSYCTAAELSASLFLLLLDSDKQPAFLQDFVAFGQGLKSWREEHLGSASKAT
jgi:hypothetical protein